MKDHGTPSSTFEQQTTIDWDTDEDQLRRSSRIRGKKADSAKLTNNKDNSDDEKVVCSALSKHENDTEYRIDSNDFRVLWRDENLYRLLINESLLIEVYKPELNRTTHSVPIIMFSDGLTTDLLPDPND
jgi:hypothetical protein